MTAIAVRPKRKTKKKSSRKPTRAQTEAAAKKLGLDLAELEGLVVDPVAEKVADPVDTTIEDKRGKIESVFKVVYESGLKYRHRYTGMRTWRVKFYDVDKAKYEKTVLPAIKKMACVKRASINVNPNVNKFGDKDVASLVVYLQ